MARETILTITGSDSTSESGIQSDIRTISVLGAKAVSVVTTITVQNTLGIQNFYDLPADIVSGQLDAIINDVQPDVVKIGMIRNIEILDVIISGIKRYNPHAVVYDPILFSARGDRLMGSDVTDQIRERLFPLCTVIVARRRESEVLLENYVGSNVCFLDDSSEHGLVNEFSSALAVFLSEELDLDEAISKAHQYLSHLTTNGKKLKGRSAELYREFLDYVARDFTSDSDVAHYADLMNVSSRYLAQVCRQIAGKSPKGIIDDYLIKAIKVSLSTTNDTIQQIADKYSFTCQAHLSKYFRNLTGLSPTEYRNSKL